MNPLAPVTSTSEPCSIAGMLVSLLLVCCWVLGVGRRVQDEPIWAEQSVNGPCTRNHGVIGHVIGPRSE